MPEEAKQEMNQDQGGDNLERESVHMEIEDERNDAEVMEQLDNAALESAIEQAEANKGDMDLNGAQLTMAYELGIPADEFSRMNAQEKQLAIEEAINSQDDKQLLTKLRSGMTGKALKMMFAVGGVLMVGSSVMASETGPTPDIESDDDGDQEGEKMLNWPQIKNAVMDHLKTLHNMGISQDNGSIFLEQAVDSAQAVQDNGGSTQEALDKIEALFEQKYDAEFYSNPDNAAQLKGFQMNANDMMEQAAINIEDVSNDALNNFQSEAWDWADYCVKNGGSEDTYKGGLQKIYERHFSSTSADTIDQSPEAAPAEDQDSTPTAEEAESATPDIEVPYEVKVKGFQTIANDMMEKAAMNFGDNVSQDQLNEFQAEAWSFADYCAQNGAEDSQYKYGVNSLYEQHFADQLEQQTGDIMERASAMAAELAPETCPADSAMTDDWLRDNAGNTFHRGDTLITVVESQSLDMQTSISKANLIGSSELAKLVAQARGHDTDSGVSEVLRHVQNGKSAIYKSDQGKYITYQVVEVPLSDNIK